ncbi:MAG: hypothetical protein HYY52_07885 [Candidatus Melainabacteria bacterium]|nr:hypothetical protein [Candidatus Melainabacteria bacterium]
MSLRTTFYTIMAGALVGTGSMPFIAKADQAERPAQVHKELTEKEKINEEIERARKIVEEMQKGGLSHEEIQERARLLVHIFDKNLAKLEKGEEIKVLTRKEVEELTNKMKQIYLALGTLALGAFGVYGITWYKRMKRLTTGNNVS